MAKVVEAAWWFWAAWFVAWETLGIIYALRHQGDDRYTCTHFIATHIPLGVRIAVLAWLVYHFIWQHPKG